MTELGQTERGFAELEAAVASSPRLPMMLVPVYVRVARADRALAMVDEQLARVERTGAHGGEAELHRLKGEAILRHDPSAAAQAEACFRRGIEMARGQSAKWAELRSTVSLARLLRDTNRRDEARAMLAGIYNWFTEGFDTADLKDGKTLRAELSA